MSEPPRTARETTSNPTQTPPADSQMDETVQMPGVSHVATQPSFARPAEPGEVGLLGPYRVVKQLGQGGMGVVYLAFDTRLDRKVALKVMLPQFAANAAAKGRFLREARAAAQVSHDNVVIVHEADERDGVPFIAMQFLQGYPLDQYLAKKGTPSLPQVLRIARETASGLAAAHAIGLVHRDIKPANLWLEAPNGRVKVLDFGLARPVDSEVELTRRGGVVGTPAFMSPEQARGDKVDHRSDLFSLGAVLYRLCTGQLPFPGPNTMAVLTALATREPLPVQELNPEVPESLAALIHQLLAKEPEHRPPSADDLVKRIRGVAEELATPMALPVEGQPQVVYVPIQVTAQPDNSVFATLDSTEEEAPSAEPVPVAKPVRKQPGKGLWVAAGVAALLAAVAVGVVIIIIKNKDGTETRIEVPDGASVTIKDKAGKTLAQVKPGGTITGADADRKAAEWVLVLGGSVRVNGDAEDIWELDDLPKDRFTLTSIDLGGNKEVTDESLANLKDCKNLTYLELGYTLVGDAGLAHLKYCKELTSLVLWHSQVGDAGLAHLKDCKELTRLLLNGTRVGDAGLAHLKDHKKLTVLHLGNTQVRGPGLVHLKDRTGLLELFLHNTPVTDAGLAHLAGCKELTHLHLGVSGVTDAGLAHFRDCKNLTSLDVGTTPVTDVGLAVFKDCKNLTSLYLSFTKVTDAGLAQFQGRTNVEVLHLSETAVTDTGLAYFKDCRKLRQLHLQATQVTDAGLEVFKGLDSLTDLNLTGTAITDQGLGHFKDCKNLAVLHLDGTGVTDAGLAFLHECPNLAHVELRKTKATPRFVNGLRKALPDCEIEYDGRPKKKG